MSGVEQAARRDSFQPARLSYIEVGVSQAPDLLQFPPNDAVPFFEQVQIGQGVDRFNSALEQLMTWEAHRAAGYVVTEESAGESPSVRGGEAVYSAQGESFLRRGARVLLTPDDNNSARRFEVVRVLEGAQLEQLEQERQVVERGGMILGTADEGDTTGEVALSVELREDETVWALTRGFWHVHATGFLGLGKQQTADRATTALKRVLKTLQPTGE
ncbi:DUF1990 family protein [Canibacter zhoujuaniae]|uniref:DUF1990 family protein n=1 Tax=Canibacter zhoujuaniae TaxID=2708343 RepID=UPI0014224A11|nr:DUF1990 family protein [Canibacter zhoujuaniae]